MNMQLAPDQILQLIEFVDTHPRTLVLSGAGLSTASGIPDYRDRDGKRRGNAPIQGPDFRRSEAVRRRYWARSMVGYPSLHAARPNRAHAALATLEQRGRIGPVLTQNVDGLHQRAGSHRVLELHGSIHSVVCLDCHALHARSDIQAWLEAANPELLGPGHAEIAPDGDAHVEPHALERIQLPHCRCCGGTLMPDVVFFGDNVPMARTAAARQCMHEADSLLVVGSSLMVYSGFRFARMAAEQGKPIVAINLGRTRADDMLTLKIEAPAEQCLPALLDYL
jgi:NAD-dependent SIR2 family protein deacetylase